MSGARVGFTVTKKVAGSVGRNRLKRVLREVFRRNRLLFPDGCDMVVIAKSGAHLLGYEEARAELAGARAAMAHAARRARRPRREPGETDRR
jgi:ribonuclease P protein component